MRAAFLLVVLSLLAGAPPPAVAQDRIAYANIEAIISLMPETKTAAQGVDSLGRKLASELDVKESYAKQKYEEAQQAASKGATEPELDKFRKELRDLEEEIRKSSEDADTKMARHKADLMQPVLEKLETTIHEVAKAEGFTFVLNSVDGNGNSIVLYGSEDRDITKKILAKLGIAVPKGDPAKSDPAKSDTTKVGTAKIGPAKPKSGAASPPKSGTPGSGSPSEAPKTDPPKTGGSK